jgi:hypothetical protein
MYHSGCRISQPLGYYGINHHVIAKSISDCDRLDDGEHEPIEYNMIQKNNEFHKKWLGVLQGNQPCTLEAAVKLAAIQYQAYFLERTVENSVIGFCR